ncbi:MAG TPA: hypothetical protein VFU23_07745 [Gemmatimonadales bacterium]|nr:hypothetical protein [Gemmatimonadales bacterium]
MGRPRMDRYRIHAGTGLVVFQNEGVLSYQHWEVAVREALAGTGRGGIRRILSDRRRMADSYPPAMSERVVEFIAFNASQLGDLQWAVLVPDRPAAQQAVQLAQRMSQGTRMRVRAFSDLEDSLQWLLGVYEDAEVAELAAWVNG